ncbi:hypothetical protein OSTOST_09724 [Ostertagia ostertagi]
MISIALWMVYALIGYFLLKRLILEHIYIDHRGKYVFITGCDSGFGRLLALKLLKMGVNVFRRMLHRKWSRRSNQMRSSNSFGRSTTYGSDRRHQRRERYQSKSRG